MNIFISHLWEKGNITPSVLIDVAEITISLRIELRQKTEIIIITFHISMLAGIHIEYFFLAQMNRHAASEYIIKEILSAISIKSRIGSSGVHALRDLPCQFLCSYKLALKICSIRFFL